MSKKIIWQFLVDLFANFQTELQFKTFISCSILSGMSIAVYQKLAFFILISKGLMCLSTSGNYTHVEILTGNS